MIKPTVSTHLTYNEETKATAYLVVIPDACIVNLPANDMARLLNTGWKQTPTPRDQTLLLAAAIANIDEASQ